MIHRKPIKKFKNMTKVGKGVLASWRCWPPLRSQEALSALERGDRRAAPGSAGWLALLTSFTSWAARALARPWPTRFRVGQTQLPEDPLTAPAPKPAQAPKGGPHALDSFPWDSGDHGGGAFPCRRRWSLPSRGPAPPSASPAPAEGRTFRSAPIHLQADGQCLLPEIVPYKKPFGTRLCTES